MTRSMPSSIRIQVYLNDRKVIETLNREARRTGRPLSQVAGRALTQGLRQNLPADPDDRLLKLERALRDHMRATARDVTIIQELVVEFARAFFLRLPDTMIDKDPLVQASVERRIELLLDATAARIIAGGTHRARQEPKADTAADR